MRNGIKAIDIMYYVSTPEFIKKWTEAKKASSFAAWKERWEARCRSTTASRR